MHDLLKRIPSELEETIRRNIRTQLERGLVDRTRATELAEAAGLMVHGAKMPYELWVKQWEIPWHMTEEFLIASLTEEAQRRPSS